MSNIVNWAQEDSDEECEQVENDEKNPIDKSVVDSNDNDNNNAEDTELDKRENIQNTDKWEEGLSVSNLSYDATENDIIGFFSDNSCVVERVKIMYNNHGKSNGHAIIFFKNITSFNNALKRAGHKLLGREISIHSNRYAKSSKVVDWQRKPNKSSRPYSHREVIISDSHPTPVLEKSERKPVELKPRTKPLELLGQPAATSSIFGEGKPRDVFIHEKKTANDSVEGNLTIVNANATDSVELESKELSNNIVDISKDATDTKDGSRLIIQEPVGINSAVDLPIKNSKYVIEETDSGFQEVRNERLNKLRGRSDSSRGGEGRGRGSYDGRKGRNDSYRHDSLRNGNVGKKSVQAPIDTKVNNGSSMLYERSNRQHNTSQQMNVNSTQKLQDSNTNDSKTVVTGKIMSSKESNIKSKLEDKAIRNSEGSQITSARSKNVFDYLMSLGRGRGKALTLPAWMTHQQEGSESLAQDYSLVVDSNNSDVTLHESTNTMILSDLPSSVSMSSNAPNLSTQTLASAPLPPNPPSHITNISPNILPPNPQAIPPFQTNTLPNFPMQTPQMPFNMNAPMFSHFSGVPDLSQHMLNPMMQNFVQPSPFNPAMNYQYPMPLLPRIPTMQSQPSGSVNISDPNNEKSNWSAHVANDGRKYWYNKVSEMSTFDKPFCLKTPEERSIPPCRWKQYSADGKKYYSDGKESVWEEPEEHKVWREKIEAIELKASAPPAPQPPSVSEKEELKKKQVISSINATPAAVVYASQAEAVEAFHSLLSDKKISSIAKAKEIKEVCQDDPRWTALKTTGERNQAIAEYQTKKLKQEKEQKLSKAKRQRDAFLVMLAENTNIDARTRWSQAIEILKDDVRYKNVEDSREREDLFSEFISELIKKEREDKAKLRDLAHKYLALKLDELYTDGIISRLTLWADSKDAILEKIRGPETRILDDFDIKRDVQDFIGKLELMYREDEKKKREERIKQLSVKQLKFQEYLEKLAKDGLIKPEFRWKDVYSISQVPESIEFKELSEMIELTSQGGPRNVSDHKIFKDISDKVINNVKNSFRSDRRLFREALDELKIYITPKTTYQQVKVSFLKFASLQEILDEESGKFQLVADASLTEDGEEIDDSTDITDPSISIGHRRVDTNVSIETGTTENVSLVARVRVLLKERLSNLNAIFDEYLSDVVREFEEDQRRQLRREERFIELLQEYFYRSDQIDIHWDDAKRLLDRHSAYDALTKSDRKRLFNDYMNDLKKKMESKNKKILKTGSSSTSVLLGKERDQDVMHENEDYREKIEIPENERLKVPGSVSEVNCSIPEASSDCIGFDNNIKTVSNDDKFNSKDHSTVLADESTIKYDNADSDNSNDEEEDSDDEDSVDNKDKKSKKEKKVKKDKHRKEKHKHKKHKREKNDEADNQDRKKRHRSGS